MSISQEKEKYSKVTPALIEHLHECIENHTQVVNSPIFNNTFLVPDNKRSGKKTRVSELLLQIPIRELHNDLIYESIICQLKEATDKSTGKKLISDTSLHALMNA